MKVVFVVDNVPNINSKINMIKSNFGDNIIYVVKSNLISIYKTFGLPINATYYNNLPIVLKALLSASEIEDTIIIYSSLSINNDFLLNFRNSIGNKQKIVVFQPAYNGFEKFCHKSYNLYVKSLFKIKDSMISPKLQFLPKGYVDELIASHFGNRLFEYDEEVTKVLRTTDKEIDKSAKTAFKFDKNYLLSIIIALVLTIGLILSLKFLGLKYIIIFIFILLYILDILLTIIYQCKKYFDERFFK